MVSADNLNLDVLEVICSFLSGNDLPSVALVSSSFLAAVIPRLYNTISYRLRQCKGYGIGETMSPFAAVLAHPRLGVHVRSIDIRSIPMIKGRIHPVFMRECKMALRESKNLETFTCTVPNAYVLAIFLPSLKDKANLKNLRICANLLPAQSPMLLDIKNIVNLVVEFASWNVVNTLPVWTRSISNTLSNLTLYMINELHEEILKSILFQLPSLRGLHIVGCQKVDHLVVLRLVAYTPLLESLSLTTSESTHHLTLPPPPLRHLKHLAFDTKYTLQPSPSPAILATILEHIKLSSPPLTAFTIKLPERKVVIGEPFIAQLVKNHGDTLKRLAFLDCGVSLESVGEICKNAVHLEQLEVAIPMKDMIPFSRQISLSNTLHTLIDAHNHIDHGIRPSLNQDNARYMMTLSSSLRKIVTNYRIWTGRVVPQTGVFVSLEKRQSATQSQLWFMPRN